MATTEKTRQAKARREFHKLNKTVGCDLEIERMDGYRNYWVTGPEDVYGDGEPEPYVGTFAQAFHQPRIDPCEGDHIAIDWQEALDKLNLYAFDLHFHWLDIDSDTTDEIVIACKADDQGGRLLAEWTEGPRGVAMCDVGCILADWLLDQGEHDLADAVRTAVSRVRQALLYMQAAK